MCCKPELLEEFGGLIFFGSGMALWVAAILLATRFLYATRWDMPNFQDGRKTIAPSNRRFLGTGIFIAPFVAIGVAGVLVNTGWSAMIFLIFLFWPLKDLRDQVLGRLDVTWDSRSIKGPSDLKRWTLRPQSLGIPDILGITDKSDGRIVFHGPGNTQVQVSRATSGQMHLLSDLKKSRSDLFEQDLSASKWVSEIEARQGHA